MDSALVLVGSVFVFVAAVVHLGFFFLESVLWAKPRVQALFGVRNPEDGEVLRPLMFNQGFYNVFLALGAGIGLVLYGTETTFEGGLGVAMFSLVSMLLAGLVLLASDRALWRGALLQAGPPLIALVLLGIGLWAA